MARCIRSALVFLFAASTIVSAQNTYDVNFTSTAPTIDGVVSPGEWDDAAAAAGGYRLLRDDAGTADAHNNRFQMKWDDDNLYILTQSDYDGWFTSLGIDQIDFGADSVSLYFDPNRDGEPLQGDPSSPFNQVDGYQVAVNQYVGTFSCTACSTEVDDDPSNPLAAGQPGSGLGTFAEAHVDNLFGNQGEWEGLRGTTISTVNGSSGSVIEFAIPWSDFDAPQLDASGLETGLNLGGVAPVNDERWNFQAAAQTTDNSNFLPVWNWHTNPDGNEFFASHPHGEIVFVGRGGGANGDFDGDGDYACADVDSLVAAIASQSTDLTFDLNSDGTVTADDLTSWLAEAGAAELASGNSYAAGDADLNGVVDVSDFNIWNGSQFTNTPAFCSGDFNADGVVDVGDFNIWNSAKFTSQDGIAAVPEPEAVSLLAMAGLFFYGCSRRRRK